MSGRSVATSTLWQFASQAVMAALSIVTVKFVAVGLSTELAGNYNSAYSYLQLFGILADFGLYAVAVREVSRATDQGRVLGGLIVVRALILATALATALAFVWASPGWRETPLPLAVTIAALVPLFTLLSGILRTVFQVRYAMHWVFTAEVSQRVVTVALIGLLVAFGARGSHDLQDLHLFLFIGGIGAFVLFLISMIGASRFIAIRPRWDGALLRSLLRQAAPYGLAFFFLALYRQSDVTLIALLRPDYDLQNAYYGFALRATEMTFIVPTFLLNSALPALARKDGAGGETRHFLSLTLFAILLIGSTAMLYAFFWARPLMQLLTTDQYLSTMARPGSDTALQLLSMPMLLNGIVLFCFYALLTRHAWKPLVGSLALGAGLSILLNLWFIPVYGFTGACMTSIVVHLFLVALLLPQTRAVLPFDLPGSFAARGCLYAICLAMILAGLRPWLTGPVQALIGLLVALPATGLLLWGSGALTPFGFGRKRS